jgi:hypothetical protein
MEPTPIDIRDTSQGTLPLVSNFNRSSRVRKIRFLWRNLARGSQRDRDLDDEVRGLFELRDDLRATRAAVQLTIGPARAPEERTTGFMFGAPAVDGAVYVGAAVLFATAGLMASYLPARRASRVEPTVALRYE